jgi:hypothetical protein
MLELPEEKTIQYLKWLCLEVKNSYKSNSNEIKVSDELVWLKNATKS